MDEAERVLRESSVFAKAVELFEGDAEAASWWFRTPAWALGGWRPIDLLETDEGSRKVEALIGRLEHGVLT